MSLLRSRPLRSKSDKAKARDLVLADTKRELLRRSGGACEGCGSREYRLDGAHLVGRGNKGIGQPWCDLPELMAVLCHSDPRDGHVGCHEAADRGLAPELLENLRRDAVVRFGLLTDIDFEFSGEYAALDALRFMAGEAERLGVMP